MSLRSWKPSSNLVLHLLSTAVVGMGPKKLLSIAKVPHVISKALGSHLSSHLVTTGYPSPGLVINDGYDQNVRGADEWHCP